MAVAIRSALLRTASELGAILTLTNETASGQAQSGRRQ
jgi:hypothetical protein